MREAGVDLVTVGVFSWALLEPEQGRFELGWLDRGARPAARRPASRSTWPPPPPSPPPWLTAAHPEIAAAHAPTATVLWPGGRQAFCPSSPVFRERALALVDAARRAVRRPPGRW